MSRETLTDGYVQLMADLYDPQLISRASMTFTLSASSALNVAGGGTPRITLGSGASANCNASHKRWGSCSGFCGGCRRSNYARPIEAGLRVYYVAAPIRGWSQCYNGAMQPRSIRFDVRGRLRRVAEA